MSSWNCVREQERQKREVYLQQRVKETLRLSPPDLPTQACATYTPTLEERKTTARQYKDKLRMNRILQVRAQESLLAAQRVSQYRDRREEDTRVTLNYLKGVWRNDQRQCIANLEEEFVKSCRSIGESHEAALVVESNRAANEKLAARQAEEGAEQQQDFDAWRAADVRRENIKCEKKHRIELDTLLQERQLERGNAAIAKELNDQRMAMLEHEVGEAFRHEDRKKDHIPVVANPGFGTRPASVDDQRRVVYTKHKISNPLSCPGLPHTSRTCSRCRSCIALIPRQPGPVNDDITSEFSVECEPAATPEIRISV